MLGSDETVPKNGAFNFAATGESVASVQGFLDPVGNGGVLGVLRV